MSKKREATNNLAKETAQSVSSKSSLKEVIALFFLARLESVSFAVNMSGISKIGKWTAEF